MLIEIFETISAVISNFSNALGDVFSGVQSIFMVENSTGDYTMTFFGTLCLIAAGVGIVYWAFRMIKGLIKRA